MRFFVPSPYPISVYKLKYLAFSLVLATSSVVWGAVPVLTVASPANNGSVGSPVYFDATASTSTCAAGISAIRIYSAPGVSAFTTEGFHLETFVTLKPGTYNTVIQVWDNCGNVTKVARTITVTSKAGVSVFLPKAGANTTPVHFAVSAQSPACPAGISAVRIYPASGVNAYTLNGPTLDAFINLIPGTYDAIAQAWDNCGNVYKTPVTVKNTGGPPGKYLYVTDQDLNNVVQYTVKNGVLSIPGGAAQPPTYPVPANVDSAVVDPSGNFLYVALSTGAVSVFEINRANGNIFPVGTVPPPANSSGLATAAMDPAGNFLFVTESITNQILTYRINRSSGALTLAGAPAATGGEPLTVAVDFTGRFVYAASYLGEKIYSYSLNTDSGALSEVTGSPVETGIEAGVLSATGTVAYVLTSNDSGMYGYSIDGSSGALTAVPGSPFLAPEAISTPYSLQLDPIHNLLFYSAEGFTFGTDAVFAWMIGSNGTVTQSATNEGVYSPRALALDPSYRYFYVSETDGNSGAPQIISYQYNGANGKATILSGPLSRPNDAVAEIAVSP